MCWSRAGEPCPMCITVSRVKKQKKKEVTTHRHCQLINFHHHAKKQSIFTQTSKHFNKKSRFGKYSWTKYSWNLVFLKLDIISMTRFDRITRGLRYAVRVRDLLLLVSLSLLFVTFVLACPMWLSGVVASSAVTGGAGSLQGWFQSLLLYNIFPAQPSTSPSLRFPLFSSYPLYFVVPYIFYSWHVSFYHILSQVWFCLSPPFSNFTVGLLLLFITSPEHPAHCPSLLYFSQWKRGMKREHPALFSSFYTP